MKILIVRHGDPDYAVDGLTEKGKREALLLADRLCKENISAVYCSTLGRARLTAKPTLERLGIEAEYCAWLREFDYAAIKDPTFEWKNCCWDMLPSYVEQFPEMYSPFDWMKAELIRNSSVYEAYLDVCAELDRTLDKHGYRRSGYSYIAEKPNHDTIVLVCHFGLTGVLLSHLLNCSPYSIWQHVCTAPTAVTTFYSEEREEGIAHFRAASIGDISHLYVADEPPAFAARFCECFTDDTRHH